MRILRFPGTGSTGSEGIFAPSMGRVLFAQGREMREQVIKSKELLTWVIEGDANRWNAMLMQCV